MQKQAKNTPWKIKITKTMEISQKWPQENPIFSKCVLDRGHQGLSKSGLIF